MKYNELNHAGLKSAIHAPVPALLGGGDAGDEGWIARDTGSFWLEKPLINDDLPKNPPNRPRCQISESVIHRLEDRETRGREGKRDRAVPRNNDFKMRIFSHENAATTKNSPREREDFRT